MNPKVLALLALAAIVVDASDFSLEHHAPQPYAFGYKIKDKHGEQHREETGDGHGNVKGTYGFTDDRGVHREVEYVADKGGFRAKVKTNEPGTANQDPAAVDIQSSASHDDGAGFSGGNDENTAARGVNGFNFGVPAFSADNFFDLGGHEYNLGGLGNKYYRHWKGNHYGFGGFGYGTVKRYDSREDAQKKAHW